MFRRLILTLLSKHQTQISGNGSMLRMNHAFLGMFFPALVCPLVMTQGSIKVDCVESINMDDLVHRCILQYF